MNNENERRVRRISKEEIDCLPSMKPKMWFNLKECCEMKGLNYKTVCNRTELQPNRGRGNSIGGRKCFRRDVVIQWLSEAGIMMRVG